VKESIFNLIFDRISGSVVLDLFAGSGAFGAECISRGAQEVYFIDEADKAIKTIRQNTLNMTEKFEIIKSDFVAAINKFASMNKQFDLVYLDPPYDSDYALKALKLLEEKNLLADNATIVVEHKLANDLQNMPKCYIIEKSRKYGIAYVDILGVAE
jgi:16S rRNA (guanine(966)-N(2))-methyltransferase RsmD